MQQVSVRTVDLDYLEPCAQCPLYGGCECLTHRVNLAYAHRLRSLRFVVEGNCARTINRRPSAPLLRNTSSAVPRTRRARLASRMRQLRSGHSALLLDKFRDPAQKLHVLIFPIPEVLRTNPPVRC